MENSGNTGARIHEVVHSPFNHGVRPRPPQNQFLSGVPDTSNFMYGVGGVYEQPGPPRQQNVGELPFNFQPYGAASTPTTVGGPGPNIRSGPSTFQSYATSLPAPPPYTTQHPQAFASSDLGRAGPLPMNSSHPMQRYLPPVRSHLLRLPGNNPNGQPQSNAFPSYGMPPGPQRLTSFHSPSFVSDQAMKHQSSSGEVAEADSSSALREASSHINRKKRKACGRCAPCQRKNNCGTCMNCVNRAKGKQICIFRKCEELKKKPGAEIYGTEHNADPAVARHEKRKDLDNLFLGERKRSRAEDPGSGLTQLVSLHPPLPQKFSGYSSHHLQQNFTLFPAQHGLSATGQTAPLYNCPQTEPVVPTSAYSRSNISENSGVSTIKCGPPDTTDIISEALREIEDHSEESRSDLTNISSFQPLLTSNGKDNAQTTYQSHQLPSHGNAQYPQWNQIPSSAPSPSQQVVSVSDSGTLLQADPSRLPGQPPPSLPPDPGTGQFYAGANQFVVPNNSNAPPRGLPEQILSNLTRFNEFGSFQRNINSLNPAGTGTSKPVQGNLEQERANYAGDKGDSQPDHYTDTQALKNIGDNSECSSVELIPSVTTTLASIVTDAGGSTPKGSSGSSSQYTSKSLSSEPAMYHNSNLMPFNTSYSIASSVATMDPGVPHTGTVFQPHYSYHTPVCQPDIKPQPATTYHAMTPLASGSQFAAQPNDIPPDVGFQQSNVQFNRRPDQPPNMYRNVILQQNLSPFDSKDLMNTQPVNDTTQHNPNQSTSAPVSMTCPNDNQHGLCASQSQLSNPAQNQWAANEGLNTDYQCQPSIHTHSPSNATSGIRDVSQDTISQTSALHSHSSLSSPVSSSFPSTSPTAGSYQNSIISHMPKLAASPVPPNISGQDCEDQSVKNPELSQTGNLTTLQTGPVQAPTANVLAERSQIISSDISSVETDHASPQPASFLVHPGSSAKNQNPSTLQGVVLRSQMMPFPIPIEAGVSINMQGRPLLQGSSSPQLTQSHQTLPAARSYKSANVPAPMCPRAPSDPMQPRVSNMQAMPITSPNDTNITISPGESGYDSAELTHGADEVTYRQKQQAEQSRIESFEAKKDMHDELHSDVSIQTGSKNLHEAPVGIKVGSTACAVGMSTGNDLTSAGACGIKSSHILAHDPIDPTQNFGTSHAENSHMRRSLSCDNYMLIQKTDNNSKEKQAVRLRRYSSQFGVPCKGDMDHPNICQNLPHIRYGHKTSSPACTLAQSKTANSPAILGSQEKPHSCEYNSAYPGNKFNDVDLKSNPLKAVASPSWETGPASKKSRDQKPLYPTDSSGSNYNGFHEGIDAVGERKLLPFDTPPMTPRSIDLDPRKLSCEAQLVGMNNPNGPNILPTPPYSSDPSMSKTATFFGPTTEKPSIGTPFTPIASQQKDSSPGLRGYKVTDNSDKSTPPRTQFATCSCIAGSDGTNDDAPYYTHLGAAESIQGIRKLFEKRTGYFGPALRIEKVIYTGKEGKTSRGCPIAKWIIRRSSEEEKVLIVCRQRPGHRCGTAVIVVIILLWDGVARPLADFAYSNYSNLIPKHGEPTERRCGTNDERTCACQGFDEDTCGASFSFGCSWSMYYNGCKYARSNQPNKYKLTGTKNAEAEKFVGMLCERLATVMSPLYKMAAPDAFFNQVQYEDQGFECRLGENTEKNSKPFSGVTACMDFCAHAHKDQHNMDNGSTIVVTFTKPELRSIGSKPADEQLHVLPLYKLDLSNEEGNFHGVSEKISKGAVEILRGFRREVRLRKEPKLTKKQKSRAKKKGNSRSSTLDDAGQPFKRRGRPPKRARSVENLMSEDVYTQYDNPMSNDQISHNRFLSPPRAQRLVPGSFDGCQRTSFQFSPGFHNPCAPTRWPYRRQTPSFQTPDRLQQSNPMSPPCLDQRSNTVSVGNVEEKTAANEHLPSIGSFFHENSTNQGSVDDRPPTGPHTPQMAGMHPSRATPLPSIRDVVSHPFHETFAVVKNEPDHTGAMNPGTFQSFNATDPSRISLKAYAAPNAPHQHLNSMTIDHTAQSGETDSVRNPTSMALFSPSTASVPHGAQETSPSLAQEFVYSDSEDNFMNSDIGGVAVAPGHGSVLIECAKKELHATTPLLCPDRFHPSRISLVFYQHKNLNARNHGASEYEAKEEKRQKQREEKKLEELLKAQEHANSTPTLTRGPNMMMPEPISFNPWASTLPTRESLLHNQQRGLSNDPFGQIYQWNQHSPHLANKNLNPCAGQFGSGHPATVSAQCVKPSSAPVRYSSPSGPEQHGSAAGGAGSNTQSASLHPEQVVNAVNPTGIPQRFKSGYQMHMNQFAFVPNKQISSSSSLYSGYATHPTETLVPRLPYQMSQYSNAPRQTLPLPPATGRSHMFVNASSRFDSNAQIAPCPQLNTVQSPLGVASQRPRNGTLGMSYNMNPQFQRMPYAQGSHDSAHSPTSVTRLRAQVNPYASIPQHYLVNSPHASLSHSNGAGVNQAASIPGFTRNPGFVPSPYQNHPDSFNMRARYPASYGGASPYNPSLQPYAAHPMALHKSMEHP